jgi:hypothetical protein
MSKYQVGSRWEMFVDRCGVITFEIVTILEVTNEGNVIVDGTPPLTFRPDGTELHPFGSTGNRVLIMPYRK